MQYTVWCALNFFFSSRRRHTRYWRDWSSDVCSSDLGSEDEFIELYNSNNAPLMICTADGSDGWALVSADGVVRFIVPNRSEERRVGKECRSRWSPYH